MPTHTLPPIGLARPEAERIEQLISRLESTYRIDPAAVQVVKVPLRICPLGAHIDHQLGRVTGLAIDRSILMAFAPSNDGTVHVDSLEFSPAISFSLDRVPPYQRGDWGNYVRGAVLGLLDRFQLQQGLVGVIGGDMPIGGLSSSAAVTIAYLLALQAINNLAMPPEENVALVRFTENQYIGLNNGILDQAVILFSRRKHLTVIDCQSIQIDPIPTPLRTDEFDIMIVYSGVTQALVGTDYNNRVAECREAARLLLTYGGIDVGPDPRLRLVPPDLFEAEGHRLPETLWRRAIHYFGEMQRVTDGVAAWQAGDLNHLGRLISESGESSIKYYECGCPQLITLYEVLRNTPGVLGVRFSGAGFRGNCIALVDPAAREAVAATIQRRYPVAHPELAEAYRIDFCQSADQAQLMSWRRL